MDDNIKSGKIFKNLKRNYGDFFSAGRINFFMKKVPPWPEGCHDKEILFLR